MRIHEVMEEAVRRRASDVLISVGSPITFHVHGVLEWQDGDQRLTAQEADELVYPMLTEAQRQEFEQRREMDLGYHHAGVSRFHVSVLRQRGSVGAVLRLVPLIIPPPADIGVAESLLVQLQSIPYGLVLVTGPTGAGKSTTVASYLEHLNTAVDFPRHIITIEDPIEFLFVSKRCVIDQREIGVDTHGYVPGLRSALRQMPHIIFVGEMRDRETMEIALTAAETGNIVISTLATQSAAKTINRIIDVFPLDDQAEIRARLALTLRAVISQVLLRRKDVPGRIAAREILFVNTPIANLIREGKVHQIHNVIASSMGEGMVLMDDSLIELWREGVVHPADVMARLEDPEKAKQVRGRR